MKGLRTLKIDKQINALKYLDYSEQNENNLIKEALIENRTHNTSWYSNIANLINNVKFDQSKLYNKDMCNDKITYK